MKEAVKLPKNVVLEEWLATHCVDFYNDATALWEICYDDASQYTQPGEGFPPSFEYRWAETPKDKPKRCSAPEYVNHVFNWIEDQIQNENLFPVDDKAHFVPEFGDISHKIFTRIFRVYAILYHSHFEVFHAQGAAKHLNTNFKHFMFFAYCHNMLESKEFGALKELVDEHIKSYKKM